MDLAGAKYFSLLDAAQAFHNIPIKPESQALTAFITAFGTYQFNRMPFGLRNTGAMYCRLVKQLLDRLKLESKVSAYFDDILVHTCTEGEHLHALDKVLGAHMDADIKLKAKKTFLFKKAVDFLPPGAPRVSQGHQAEQPTPGHHQLHLGPHQRQGGAVPDQFYAVLRLFPAAILPADLPHERAAEQETPGSRGLDG